MIVMQDSKKCRDKTTIKQLYRQLLITIINYEYLKAKTVISEENAV